MQPYQPTTRERASLVVGVVLLFSMLVGGAMLARRNLRLGRRDRRGASRLAAVVFVAGASYFVEHHVPGTIDLIFQGGFLGSPNLAITGFSAIPASDPPGTLVCGVTT
jgi:hypothetical protein